MKTYTVTIEFTTDAPDDAVQTIASDMVAQLETIEDDGHGTYRDATMEVEHDPIVMAITRRH